MSELLTPYPSTDFVDQLVTEQGLPPLGTELVRGLYLAYFYGQQDLELTYGLAAKAAGQAYFFLDFEKPEYPRLTRQLMDFFRADGPRKLAAASLREVEGPAEELEQADADAATMIQAIWPIFSSHLPDYHKLLQSPPRHKAIIKNRQKPSKLPPDTSTQEVKEELRASVNDLRTAVNETRTAVRLTRIFMAVDSAMVEQGRPLGMFADEPHESMLREAVLSRPRRATPAGQFNERFAHMQAYCTSGRLRPELHHLERAWKLTHRGEDFYPEEYWQAQADRSVAERILDKTLFRWLVR